MVILVFVNHGSKVRTNNTNHSYSSRQAKWMVIWWVFVSWCHRIVQLDASSTSPAEPSLTVAKTFIMEVQPRGSISVHLWQPGVVTTLSECSTAGSASRDLTRVRRTGSMEMENGVIADWVEHGGTTCTSSVSWALCWFDHIWMILACRRCSGGGRRGCRGWLLLSYWLHWYVLSLCMFCFQADYRKTYDFSGRLQSDIIFSSGIKARKSFYFVKLDRSIKFYNN